MKKEKKHIYPITNTKLYSSFLQTSEKIIRKSGKSNQEVSKYREEAALVLQIFGEAQRDRGRRPHTVHSS